MRPSPTAGVRDGSTAEDGPYTPWMPRAGKTAKTLPFTGDPRADKYLVDDPLALLIGMVLDQQVPLEKAFADLGCCARGSARKLDAAAIAAMPSDELTGLFVARPALHRFPGSMAARVQDLCRLLVEEYGGDAAAVWTTATSRRRALQAREGTPRFRRAQGPDIRRPARQAARRPPAGLGDGGGAVRQSRFTRFRGRYRQPGCPLGGARAQASRQGGRHSGREAGGPGPPRLRARAERRKVAVGPSDPCPRKDLTGGRCHVCERARGAPERPSRQLRKTPPAIVVLLKKARLPDCVERDQLPTGDTEGVWMDSTRWSSVPPSGQPPPGSRKVDYS